MVSFPRNALDFYALLCRMIRGQMPIAWQNILGINKFERVQDNRFVYPAWITLLKQLKEFQKLVNHDCKNNLQDKVQMLQLTNASVLMFIFCMVIYVCDYKSIPSVYFVALQVLSLNIVKPESF